MDGLLAGSTELQEFEIPWSVSYMRNQKLFCLLALWPDTGCQQRLSASWAVSGYQYVKWLSVTTNSTCTEMSVPTVLPEVTSSLKHNAACRESCFRGREANRELFESKSVLIVDVHFQHNIQRTNHANPNSREISLDFFIWCSEIQPTINITNTLR